MHTIDLEYDAVSLMLLQGVCRARSSLFNSDGL